ncbi:unnamed protein product [Phytophthora fragariaefolia]|uniref:Unnamed protein product n=1 Tax=Phytophthora fragariaefolia TaxID=1490495 RepID=A0A9W7D4W9_9STRA|nr:unnamed protein product [Phytophthora fragariaefolia]
MREEMDCNSTGLKLLRQQAKNALGTWSRRELFHVRRDWNASTDMLADRALRRQDGLDITGPDEIQSLRTLKRLGEVIRPRTDRPETSGPERPTTPSADAERTTASMLPVTTRVASAHAAAPRTRTPEVLQELRVQRLRLDRVRTAQDEELWIANLKRYMRGELGSLSKRIVKDCRKIAPQYEEGESGLLYYRTRGDESAEDRDAILKLVIPETLQDDVLHHYHASLEGGHQGIGRTYQRVRRHFHWPGIFKSVQRYVGECTDCETGKGRPTIRGESPGNIIATYPFQVIAKDHIPSLPVSYKGNTELLVWVDLCTGFVIAKSYASRSAQTVAEAYEEAVFRQFGASEAIRHHREPGSTADFFKAFNKLMGQRQRATLAYHPQVNVAAERMVQTVTRAVKMYIADVDQRDWDEYAERLTFALNTATTERGTRPPVLPRARLGRANYAGSDALDRKYVTPRRSRPGLEDANPTALQDGASTGTGTSSRGCCRSSKTPQRRRVTALDRDGLASLAVVPTPTSRRITTADLQQLDAPMLLPQDVLLQDALLLNAPMLPPQDVLVQVVLLGSSSNTGASSSSIKQHGRVQQQHVQQQHVQQQHVLQQRVLWQQHGRVLRNKSTRAARRRLVWGITEEEQHPDRKHNHKCQDRVHNERWRRLSEQHAVRREFDPHQNLKRRDREDHPRILPQAPAFWVCDELVVLKAKDVGHVSINELSEKLEQHLTSAAAGMPIRNTRSSLYELKLLSLGMLRVVSMKKAFSSVIRHNSIAYTISAKRLKLENTSQ